MGEYRIEQMQARSSSSVILLYVGVVASALSVIAFGLMSIMNASAGLSSASARDKTVLELQVENSREIRRALAVPVVTAPLPPITARPARAVTAAAAPVQNKSAPVKLSREARNAMAMGQVEAPPSVRYQNSAPDRHTQY
jgi:hypothetical protein